MKLLKERVKFHYIPPGNNDGITEEERRATAQRVHVELYDLVYFDKLGREMYRESSWECMMRRTKEWCEENGKLHRKCSVYKQMVKLVLKEYEKYVTTKNGGRPDSYKSVPALDQFSTQHESMKEWLEGWFEKKKRKKKNPWETPWDVMMRRTKEWCEENGSTPTPETNKSLYNTMRNEVQGVYDEHARVNGGGHPDDGYLSIKKFEDFSRQHKSMEKWVKRWFEKKKKKKWVEKKKKIKI